MSYTKGTFVTAALEEIGLGSYIEDIPEDRLRAALVRLDSMMARWNFSGIRVGWPMSSSPTSSEMTDEVDISDSTYEAIITNLAITLAPSYGKVASRETKVTAKNSYRILQSISMDVLPTITPYNIPAGAGNKARTNANNRFIQPPEEPLEAGDDNTIDFD